MPSTYEADNRAIKAFRLTMYIRDRFREAIPSISDSDVFTMVEKFSDEDRSVLANAAQVNKPSERTWELVSKLLRSLIQ